MIIVLLTFSIFPLVVVLRTRLIDSSASLMPVRFFGVSSQKFIFRTNLGKSLFFRRIDSLGEFIFISACRGIRSPPIDGRQQSIDSLLSPFGFVCVERCSAWNCSSSDLIWNLMESSSFRYHGSSYSGTAKRWFSHLSCTYFPSQRPSETSCFGLCWTTRLFTRCCQSKERERERGEMHRCDRCVSFRISFTIPVVVHHLPLYIFVIHTDTRNEKNY